MNATQDGLGDLWDFVHPVGGEKGAHLQLYGGTGRM